jgi:hypothetical protein
MKLVLRCAISAAVLGTILTGAGAAVQAQEVITPAPRAVPDTPQAPRPYALPPPPTPRRYVSPPPSPPPAYVPPPRYVPVTVVPPPEHDGFFLRMHFGGGALTVSGRNSAGQRTTFVGGSASLGIAAGVSIAEDVILFGNLFVSAADGPTINTAGATGTSRGSAAMGGAGAGLTYYFMPANVYISGALAAVVFSLDDALGNTVYSSNTGLGFQAMMGKEWLLAPEWGMGFAVEATFASMRDKNDPTVYWDGSAVALLFSSTFN